MCFNILILEQHIYLPNLLIFFKMAAIRSLEFVVPMPRATHEENLVVFIVGQNLILSDTLL